VRSSRGGVIREDHADASVERVDALAREHRDFLAALARKLCRGHQDADDLVQEVLLRAVTHSTQLPSRVNLRAWMTQLMKNAFVDQLRRAKTRSKVDSAIDPAPEEAADQLPWWHALDAEHVRAATAELPDELRETFERFAFRGESYQVIAEALAIPKTTVGTRILRARRRIKALLEARVARGQP
jgi:RNA polymerase sigma-70 factor, ECF subfamily